jgi:two-component system nitrogen regulation sensor histidine kinase GlnL
MISPESVMNSLDEAILVFDRSFRVVLLNRAAEELLGRGLRGITHRRFDELFGNAEGVALMVKKTLNEGRSYNAKEVDLDIGRSLNADITLSPLYIENSLRAAILTLKENTALPARDDYQFDSLLYMLGSLAHEIKNPLSGIKGAAQLLRRVATDQERAEGVGLILKEVDRLNSVLQGYLTMTRKPVCNPLNMHEVVEHALKVLDPVITERHVTVTKSYDPSLPLVTADESKLLQVFINLVKNAVESMEGVRRKRILTIVTRPSDAYTVIHERGETGMEHSRTITRRWVAVMIKDTGVGIAKEAIGKVFLPFYTNKHRGSGLGLSLSQKIIKDHGGIIRVTSEAGKGATFSVHLPYTKSATSCQGGP